MIHSLQQTLRIIEYRAWAHRALDTLISYRLNWEKNSRDQNQPYHSNQASYAESNDAADELYQTTLMFANKLIGRRVMAFNAEMFDESAPLEMRAALRNVIQKMRVVWPSRPTVVSEFYQRRSIQSDDLMDSLIDLDKGHTPDLCVKGIGRESDVMKEQCRFAGVLWSIYLEENGTSNYTSRVVSAFGLRANGKTTVQSWKRRVRDSAKYARKLGYDHDSYVTSLVSRAKLVDDSQSAEEFGLYISFNIFGGLHPSLNTLEGIGALYQTLRVKS